MAAATNQLVLDASIAVAWHLRDEEHSNRAHQLLDSLIAGELRLVAPQHIHYEVSNAITVAAQRREPRLSREEARLGLVEFLKLDIPTVSDDALLSTAQSVAFQYGCAFYDGLYLALAERLDIPLITADRKLYLLVSTHPLVLWIADYREP